MGAYVGIAGLVKPVDRFEGAGQGYINDMRVNGRDIAGHATYLFLL
tara:strand:- start:14633 stop:14770 length:138 start_codon:yes stop_codon:yes gene_type:complete